MEGEMDDEVEDEVEDVVEDEIEDDSREESSCHCVFWMAFPVGTIGRKVVRSFR